MKRIRKGMTVTALALVLAVTGLALAQRSGEVALRAAIETEMVRGVNAAIEEYKRVADTYGRSDPATAAQALLRMAQAYEKLGNTQAASVYERIARDFGGQREAAATARERLAALRSTSAPVSGMSMKQVFSGESINGTVSPDGKWVSFTDWSTGGNLAVRDLVSGTKRVLTQRPEGSHSGSYAEGSVISPDSRQVAYLWAELPEWEFQVRIVPIDGNAAPRIVHRSKDYLFVRGWTSDGKSLLVTRLLGDKTWQIAMLSVQDGSIRQLKSLSWSQVDASLSPDGRYIAYDTPVGNGTSRDIFVLATDGSHEAAIVQHPANDHSAVWSPDSSRILFLSNRTATPSLWSVPIKDGKAAGTVEPVKGDIGTIVPLTMTPTGTFYYLVSGRARQNVYRAALGDDGKISGIPEVVTDSYVNSNWGASLSVDGKHLAYYSDRQGTVLVVRDLSSGRERVYPLNLAINTLYFNGPGWLPDGSVLVHASEPQRPERFLYRVDMETGNAQQVVSPGAGFRVSPDGRFVVSQVENSSRLERLDLTTRQVTAIREVPRPNDMAFVSPAISADGKQVAYVQLSKSLEIVVTSAAGGEARTIFRYPEGSDNPYNTLAWTPDHRFILFTKEEQSVQTIWRVPVSGGPAELVGAPMKARIKGIQTHPDGRSLFFTAAPADSAEIWTLENFLPASTAR